MNHGGNMNELENLVDAYCEGWSSASAAERERLIRETLTEDATYSDPRTSVLTLSSLIEHIARIQRARPGAKVRRTSAIESHHGVARFSWDVQLPDGTTMVEGVDFIELSAAGTRISRVVGFFGTLQRRESEAQSC